MAVGFDVASESHTGTTGSASQASFTWNHAGGASARGALVFVFGVVTNALPPVTSVTYGGVAMTAIPYTAIDTDTEPGSVRAYYLDNCGTGTKAVVVNRTNNTHVMYAVCFTVTAASATEVYLAGVQTKSGSTAVATGASSTGTGTGTLALLSVTDGSPGTNSLRFMGRYQGTSNVTAAGTGSTAGPSIDFGLYVIDTFYETTAGQGARNVGGATITDDVAAIALAVREIPPVSGSFAADAVINKTQSGSFAADAVVKKTGIAGSFTADAIQRKTTSPSFTANAFVTGFLANAEIEGWGDYSATWSNLWSTPSITGSFSASAVIKKTAASTLAADAVIKATGSGTFSASSWLQKSVSGTFGVSACIKGAVSGSVPADAIRLRTFHFGEGVW
jgi:hypothetical protein